MTDSFIAAVDAGVALVRRVATPVRDSMADLLAGADLRVAWSLWHPSWEGTPYYVPSEGCVECGHLPGHAWACGLTPLWQETVWDLGFDPEWGSGR